MNILHLLFGYVPGPLLKTSPATVFSLPLLCLLVISSQS